MIYHSKYNVNPADVVDGAINWKITGNGAFIIAEYGGTKYFVKRYTMGPRMPTSEIPEPVYSDNKKTADGLTQKQEEIRRLFKKAGLNVDTHHIVVEEENFWDDDNMFVTVTRVIPNENEGFDYKRLSQKDFVKLCCDITELIRKIHDAGVTHGDLKEKNILIQNNSGAFVPYLIDFDSSYPSDYPTRKKSDGTPMLSVPIVYSPGYQSPEIAINNFNNDNGDEVDTTLISNKTDIFTLALIFHKLWTGIFPTVIGDDCPVAEAVYMGTPIRLDSKFDVTLGANNECKFSGLLEWMLSKEGKDRPTAQQVLDVLNDRLDVGEHFAYTGAPQRFDLDPHRVHESAIEILDREALRALGLRSLVKITEGGNYKYLVRKTDGSEFRYTVDELITNGYAKAKPISLGTLFPEDSAVIEFVSADEIAKLGVISIEPRDLGFRKFYFVKLMNGGGYTASKTALIDRGIARLKPVTPVSIAMDDAPWPEHGSSYRKENLIARKIIKIEKVVEDGQHKYKIIYDDGGTQSERIVAVSYLKIMKIL